MERSDLTCGRCIVCCFVIYPEQKAAASVTAAFRFWQCRDAALPLSSQWTYPWLLKLVFEEGVNKSFPSLSCSSTSAFEEEVLVNDG